MVSKMDKNDTVEVSIVCITYNHAKFIKKAIDGFLKQKTNFKYEIIIHDDLSTDGTREILLDYQKKYPDKIRLLLEDENQFSKDVRILLALCLPAVKGRYVAVSDGDDEWVYDKKLLEQYEFMQNNPDVSMCIHNAVRCNMQTGEEVNQIEGIIEDRMLTMDEVILGTRGSIPVTSIFFRSKYIPGIPDYCFRAPVGDEPLMTYYACKGGIYYMNKIWAKRNYMHEGSWNFRMQNISLRLDYIKKYLIYLEELNCYSNMQFNNHIREKIYRMCSWEVELLLPQYVRKMELRDIINRIEEETKNQVDDLLEDLYEEKKYRCIDYLHKEIVRFITKCYEEKGNLFLYGTGRTAKEFAEKLEYMKIPFEGFVVSEDFIKEEDFMDHKVEEIEEISREKSFLWLTLDEKNTRQVLHNLRRMKFKNILYTMRYENIIKVICETML